MFNDFEKKIIDKILDYKQKSNINCLYNWLSDNDILQPINISNTTVSYADVIHPAENETQFYFHGLDSSNISQDDYKKIDSEYKDVLIQLLCLIEYLVKNDYLFFEPTTGKSKLRNDSDAGTRLSNLLPPKWQEKFYFYSSGSFFSSKKLEILQKNKYREDSEIAFDEQIKSAKNANKISFGLLIITILTAFASPFVALYIHNDEKCDSQIKVEDTVNDLKISINLINSELKQFEKNIAELNVKIKTECHDGENSNNKQIEGASK